MPDVACERNLRLLPAFEAGRYALFWLPLFFLYFSSVLPVEQVLLLESVYYFGTVFLEVPSGWFSDRVGRRITLVIAMVAQIVGCSIFAFASSLVPFLVAQICLSTSTAFVSGTNHALLYDSLRALGRENEVGQHSQALVSRGFLALAVSSLVGGFLGGFDLRIAYGLTALSSAVALGFALSLVEPHRESGRQPRLRDVFGRLRQKPLAWVFLFAVSMMVFNHVPYEFFQPYTAFLFEGLGWGSFQPTPLITGIVFSVMMLLSSLSATRSIALSDRVGRAPALLLCMVLQGTIITAMMAGLHPLVLVLVALRSVPMGLSYPVQSTIIQPRIPSEIRATYLSVQSLVGSLAFSGTLFLAAGAVRGLEWSRPLMSDVLRAYAIACGIVLALLWLLRAWLRDEEKE